ncbi:Glycosyl transferase protein [Marine Group I thaumarchaeote SCGC RSA3]|uniref:Group 1 glycosyl transferase protein n=2 Tax=Marine Group I TaxID=905826 RepID=A0A087RM35_9ARCH|nr:group 1 glycosyl transferase protein [Marine Group I thaumarchaeote SCGC AAA799-D11]KFM19933.1 Glycosyl transferase protein [Marine Group I thaumarchaeote SCGC RSA3]
MKNLRILIVNDFASNASMFQKYFSSHVDAIYFNENPVITLAKNPIFFEKDELGSCVEKIKNLSKNYDIFLTFGWFAAAICYLANVNYVMYFVDSFIEPKYRIWKKFSFFKKKFFDDLFKDALQCANKVVAGIPNDAKTLRKYRDDVRIIFPIMDTQIFHSNHKKIKLDNDLFTFFSPQRIDPTKGHEIIFESFRYTKSDFVVLQTDWGSGDYYEKVIQNKPPNVKLISKIIRSDMPSYYVSSDALLGQVGYSSCGGTEREAILCGKPVFCYETNQFTENDPFCKSKDPIQIAKYIDKIVKDEEFRSHLLKIQKEWVMENFDPKKLAEQWDRLFLEMINENHKYKVKKRYNVVMKLYFNS